MRKVFVITLLFLTQLSFGQTAIQVSTRGAGSPILFLPGFTTPGSVWEETVRHLSGSYESHLVSYAGFNGLAPIGTPWYDPIKAQLIEYIQQEELTHITLMGHSMGGNLAIDLAAALPDQVDRLILVESIPCMRELMMPGVPASSLQYDSPYNQQVLNMPDSAFRQLVSNVSRNMTLHPDKVDSLIDWSMKANRETYVYGYTDLLKLDLRDKLSDINVETLILGAGAAYPDTAMVRSNYESQYANLHSKQFLMAEQSRHFIMFDQPEWFYERVNAFLTDNGQ